MFLMLGVLFWTIPAIAATFTVQNFSDGRDPNCLPATCTLRDAVIAANANPGPDTILLPAGTYTLSIPGAGEDLGLTGDLDLTDPESLRIEGIGNQPSVIDAGALGDRILDVHNGSLTLVNLELRGGRAGAGNGGAIRSQSSEGVNLTECRLIDNQAANRGGAVAVNASINVTDSLFLDNVANPSGLGDEGFGGAIFLGSSNFGIFATRTRFENNQALGDIPLGGNGGAILIQGSFDPTFGTPVTIDSCVFENNHADSRGGALFIGAPTTPSIASLVLLKSTLASNSAGVDGGGIAHGRLDTSPGNAGSLLFLDSNLFQENSAGDNGGGISFGSTQPSNFQSFVQNSTFAANRAGRHGGGISSIVQVGSTNGLRINQCTIQANVADLAGGGTGMGGGIHADRGAPGQSSLAIANSIVAKNFRNGQSTPAADVSAVGVGDFLSGGHNLIGNADGGQWTAATGDIVGTQGSVEDPGTANELASLGNGPDLYRLLPASQAIDAGTTVANGVYPFGLPQDQRGRNRPIPLGGRYDIGAYEFDPLDIATPSPTPTPSPTVTPTPTSTSTFTATFTPTATGSLPPTPTFTFTGTATPTGSATPTPTPTDDSVPTETPTETPTLDPTLPTATPTSAPTRVSCDLVEGPTPAPNPRCDLYDLLALLADRRGSEDWNTDFNSDGVEDGLDWFVFALEWYSTPE